MRRPIPPRRIGVSDVYEYTEGPFQIYDCGDGGVATFVRVCPACGRFVKANPTILVNEMTGLKDEPNAWRIA